MQRYFVHAASPQVLGHTIEAAMANSAGIEGCSDNSDPKALEFPVLDLEPEGIQLLEALGATVRKEEPAASSAYVYEA